MVFYDPFILVWFGFSSSSFIISNTVFKYFDYFILYLFVIFFF